MHKNPVKALIGLLAAIWIASQVQRSSISLFIGASSLMADFGITAATAGFLAAIYFPFYGLMQVPSGILADHIGPRKNIIGGGTIAGLGCLATYLAPTVEIAIAGRIVTGIAAGVLWLSMLKIIAQLPGIVYARGLSILAAMSNFGTVCILVTIPWLLGFIHWRPLGVGSALVFFLLLAVLAQTRLPGEAKSAPAMAPSSARVGFGRQSGWPTAFAARFAESRAALLRVLVGRRNWQLYLPTMMWNGANLSLPAWLPRYGRDVLGLPPEATGIVPALMPLGVVVGSFLLAQVVGRYTRPDIRWYYASATVWAILLVVLASGALAQPGTFALHVLVFLMGFVYSCYFVGMAHAGQMIEPRFLGTATGIFNGIGFFAAFAYPWLMGLIMDAIDQPTHADWTYSPTAYHAGFALIAGGLIVALIVAAVLKWSLRDAAPLTPLRESGWR